MLIRVIRVAEILAKSDYATAQSSNRTKSTDLGFDKYRVIKTP